MLKLNNKISIITGASSGIGRGTAIVFSKLGSKLTLVGRDEKALDETIRLCEAPQENIVKIIGDLTEKSVISSIVQKTVDSFGGLTTLINNAAIFGLGSIKNTSLEQFDEMMDVNMRSVFTLTQICLPYLIKEKGSVVNVSSIAGTRSFPNLLNYSMSKAALDQFTKCTALELADDHVRVNAVNPGTIVTNIHRRAGYSEEQYKQFLEQCKKTHAMGRPGISEEVANTIAFLASDNASFITGELIHVDGGRHRMSPR